MNAADETVKIVTVASCSNVRAEHRAQVVVSGSYGGRYNAFNAAKWPVRAVIMNDAGIGKDNAGIVGLEFLDRIGMAAATADAQTCHIGDGDHMLAHGIVSHVNRAAAALGCAPGQSVRDCAERLRAAAVPTVAPPAITEGARFVMRDVPGEPVLICADFHRHGAARRCGPDRRDGVARRAVRGPAGQCRAPGHPRDLLQRCRRRHGRGRHRPPRRSRTPRDRGGRHLRGQCADRRFPRALSRRHPVVRQRPASARGARVGMKLSDFIESLIATAER